MTNASKETNNQILILGENTPLSEAAGPYNISSAGCEISSENGIDFCVEPEKKTSGADEAIISLIMGPIVWFLH